MPSHVQVEATRAAAIKPFKAHIPDGVLDDLRRRLAKARWPDQLPGTTWEYGADIGAMRTLADYWQKKYDWRAQEARINRFAEFTTEIDGQRIHFIHQRSPRADAMPLLMLHGWPGSIVEFLALIEPLARPPSGTTEKGRILLTTPREERRRSALTPALERRLESRRRQPDDGECLRRLGYAITRLEASGGPRVAPEVTSGAVAGGTGNGSATRPQGVEA